jgi:UDP-N-acetylglucosamine transferase subunit ALG13
MNRLIAEGLDGCESHEVLVIVGTDHHPFNRLITWVNNWLTYHPDDRARFFVQWGAASVRPECPGAQFVTTDELGSLLQGARVIVCHGGGGSISDAWDRGQLPIVVPRTPRLSEHVDDHQITFTQRLAELGRVRVARSETDFSHLLEEALGEAEGEGDIPRRPMGSAVCDIEETIARFGVLVDELVQQRREGLSLRVRKLLSTGSVRSRPSRPTVTAGTGESATTTSTPGPAQ